VVDERSGRFRASAEGRPRKRLPVGFIFLLVFSSVLYSDSIPSVRATSSTSWNPKVQCTPLVVRITDITANQTGSGSFSASPFTPGTTTAVAGGQAKRWLTPGPTPPGWVAPGPPCTVTNSKGTTSVFVEIDGIERGSIATEDSAGSYDPTNGGTSHPTTYDTTFNIFDPSFVSSYSSSCSSSTDKTCYGRMHAEIDHDWKAAGYCGSGTVCDESALASKTSSSSTKLDIQGFVYWDPGHLTEGWHSFNGWEIHPVTGWRLSGQQDFSLSANPPTVSFNAGTTSSFTVTVSSLNGFTGSVNLSTNVLPSSGLSVGCSPNAISGGSGTSTCSLNSSTPGSYTVQVTGTSGSLSHMISVSVSVTQPPPPPDFAVSAKPTTLSIVQGSSGSSTITVNSQNGFSGTVNLSPNVSPSGPAAALSPTSVVLVSGGSASSTLSVTTGSSTTIGNYVVNVTAVAGSLTHFAIVSVSVTMQPSPDFMISASPTSLTIVQGTSKTSAIALSSVNGFSGIVGLVATTSPTGPTGSLDPSNVTLTAGGSGSSTLNVTASLNTSPATYTVNVTGTSGSLSHSTTISVTVTQAPRPDFSMSASPTSLTIIQGSSGISTISLNSVNGFSGPITLSSVVPPAGPSTSLNPASLTLSPGGSGSSTLNVTTGGAAPGTYSVNITATTGSIAHSTSVTVTITSNAPSSYALIVSYEGFVYRYYQNGTLKLFGQPVTTQLRAVAWKPDGSYALIVGDSAVLIKYDGTRLTTIPTSLSTATIFLSVAWRPDGSYALIGTSAGVLLEYDGTSVTQITTPYNQYFRAIAWNPSGTQALIVGYSGQVFLFQSTGQISLLSSGTSVGLDAVAWNPSGAYALISGDGGVVLRYNGTSFQALNTAGVYSSTLRVRYISWDPSGSQALLVGDSGLALRYDGSSLSALPVLTSSILYSVSWSAGTAYIAGGNGTILTYSGGTLMSLPFSSWSGYRGIAWKPS
jgi:hypothetical protein